jgi:CRISPR-associated protein Cas1
LSKGKLHVSFESIRYETEYGEKIDFPIKTVEDVYLNAYSEFTTESLILLAKNKVIVHFFNNYEYYIGTFIPKDHVFSGKIIIKEIEHYQDLGMRLFLAKEIMKGAFKNIKRNISYYNGRLDDDMDMNASAFLAQLEDVKTINNLMMLEAQYRRKYYSYYDAILGIKNFKRTCPKSDDIINCLISFLNSLLYSVIFSEIMKTHISGQIGFIHETGANKSPLIYDISEIFKPLMVDRVLFRLINRYQIKEEDLIDGKLTEKAIKTVFIEWDKQLNETIHHRSLKRHLSYRMLIREELYKLERHFNGLKPYRSFILWW